MFRLRSEKVLLALAVFFFILAAVFSSWTFVWLTGIIAVLAIAVTIFSFVVELRQKQGAIKIIAFCSLCRKLLPLTTTNQAPEYSLGPDYDQITKDDMAEFVKKHSFHQIKYLEVIFGPWRKSPIADPMKTSYIGARFGRKLFFIKRSRQTIMEPLKYELMEKLPDFGWREKIIRLALQ